MLKERQGRGGEGEEKGGKRGKEEDFELNTVPAGQVED